MTSVPSRIVQVSTSDIGGGAERVAADLHRSCLARGLDSTLAVGFRFDDVERTVLIPNDANRGAWARTLLPLAPTPASAMEQMGAGKRFARRLVKTLAEPRRAWRISRGYEDFDFPATGLLPTIGGARADLLHLHNLHGGYFDLRCLPQLSATVPTVITAHDTWLGSGHCAYTLDCERWQTGCGQCPYLHTPPAIRRDKTAENLALKQSIYRASKVHLVGPSRWVVGELERSVFSEALIDSHVIPNGVDQAVFRPGSKEDARRRLGLPADALVLVFSVAGEESPYKDFASIRAALPAIVAQTAPREVLLLALGGYPGRRRRSRWQDRLGPLLSGPCARGDPPAGGRPGAAHGAWGEPPACAA